MFTTKFVMITFLVVAGICVVVGMCMPAQNGGISALWFWLGVIFGCTGGITAIKLKEKSENQINASSCAHPDQISHNH